MSSYASPNSSQHCNHHVKLVDDLMTYILFSFTHIFRGFIAEMLAGPQSVALFTPQILDYLISNLDPEVHPAVIIFSIIALEKFAQTSENKITIVKQLNSLEKLNPLLILEPWADTYQNYMQRQVGFCAKWCLDNLCKLN